MMGVVGHRTPQSQPVGWKAEISQSSPHAPVPGSAWACLASLHSCHSTAPGRLAEGWEEVPEGNMEKLHSEKGWGPTVGRAVARTLRKGSLGPTCQARPGSSQEGNVRSDRCLARVGVGNPEVSSYHN